MCEGSSRENSGQRQRKVKKTKNRRGIWKRTITILVYNQIHSDLKAVTFPKRTTNPHGPEAVQQKSAVHVIQGGQQCVENECF